MARLLSSPPCSEALSTSAIVAEPGSHVLKIQGYSLTKELGNSKFIQRGWPSLVYLTDYMDFVCRC